MEGIVKRIPNLNCSLLQLESQTWKFWFVVLCPGFIELFPVGVGILPTCNRIRAEEPRLELTPRGCLFLLT